MDLRAAELARARLYFVCDAARPARELEALLEGALSGGADLIQLRDKGAEDERLLEAAPIFRSAANRHGALFLINDRPDLVAACGADGVHVGQDDVQVADARRVGGTGTIVGLSSHSPAQLDAAESARGDARPDYLSVGPVWTTPTKPGRQAAGLDYVRYAASTATLPWFAIGGIDVGNVGAVAGAGAKRVVVVRAIADAADPGSAAADLRSRLEPLAVGASRVTTR